MDARKRMTQMVCLALAAQLLATALFESIWSVVVPPVVAALPIFLLTMRSPDTVEAVAPKLRQAYVGVALVAVAVIASFAWSGDHLRSDLRFVRVVFVDLAIFWLASTLGVQAATSKQPSL